MKLAVRQFVIGVATCTWAATVFASPCGDGLGTVGRIRDLTDLTWYSASEFDIATYTEALKASRPRNQTVSPPTRVHGRNPKTGADFSYLKSEFVPHTAPPPKSLLIPRKVHPRIEIHETGLPFVTIRTLEGDYFPNTNALNDETISYWLDPQKKDEHPHSIGCAEPSQLNDLDLDHGFQFQRLKGEYYAATPRDSAQAQRPHETTTFADKGYWVSDTKTEVQMSYQLTVTDENTMPNLLIQISEAPEAVHDLGPSKRPVELPVREIELRLFTARDGITRYEILERYIIVSQQVLGEPKATVTGESIWTPTKQPFLKVAHEIVTRVTANKSMPESLQDELRIAEKMTLIK